jgi:hypothetical protein
VQHHQLVQVLTPERYGAGEQLLIDDGQTVLIGVPADAAVYEFGCRVQRRDAPVARVRLASLDIAGPVHQPEVGYLDVIAD